MKCDATRPGVLPTMIVTPLNEAFFSKVEATIGHTAAHPKSIEQLGVELHSFLLTLKGSSRTGVSRDRANRRLRGYFRWRGLVSKAN